MSFDNPKQEQMQRVWKELEEQIIQGKIAKYKIDPKDFLGRGGFGIVFGGYQCKQNNNQVQIQKVVIKQYKNSSKWSDADRDKQLVILDKYGSLFDKKYVLQTIEIFKHKKTGNYFLVMKYAEGGTLSDRYKLFNNDEDVYQFCLRMAQIMRYIHYDVFLGYKPRKKKEGKDNQQMGIIHRDIKPQNIVFATKQSIKSAYLIDFGIAKIGYSDEYQQYNNCGTINYKAVEITQGRIYNTKVDIYSFGCTLYEVLSGGEKMLTSTGIPLRYGNRMRFVQNRLIALQEALIKENKFKFVNYWMELLSYLLQFDNKKRITSIQLTDRLNNNKLIDYKNKSPKFFEKLPEIQEKNKNFRQIYEINFQIFRLNVIQDKIFSIFQYLYFQQPHFNKFLVYLIVKFSVIFILNKQHNAKHKADKIMERKDKGNTLKSIIQTHKLKELKQKSQKKLNNEIEKQKNSYGNSMGKTGSIQEFVRIYPQIMSTDTSDARRILFDICYFKINDILADLKLAKFIATILLYMQELDSFAQMKYENNDIQTSNVELFSIKRIMKLKSSNQQKVNENKLRDLFQQCKIDVKIQSYINREQIKTDIEIQRKNL